MTVVTTSSATSPLVLDCGAGKHAVGGGVNNLSLSPNQGLSGMFPATTSAGTPSADGSTNPQYWAIVFTGGTAIGYALCVPN